MLYVTNSFPWGLIQVSGTVHPRSEKEIVDLLGASDGGFVSVWGHSNTVQAMSDRLGMDIAPEEERPTLIIDDEGHPYLPGHAPADRVLVISIKHRRGRLPIGEELRAEEVEGLSGVLLDLRG